MKFWTAIGVLLLTLPLVATNVLAMGGDFGKGQTISPKPVDWPKGLEQALASQEHEGGVWVNTNDYYWFTGDTQSLNKFLAVSAKIEGAPVYIRFHSGNGQGKAFANKPPIPIDWQMSSFRRGWSDEWPDASPTDYMILIDVWDGRQIDRKALVIPNGILEREAISTTQPTTRPATNKQ